ncbi:hypothetical protein OF897_18855 [Chryseobacterium formosus]|uniref:Uncharacterized protein n=1 Tax=Chryseobacterium formosus TaxID=1537363 RepID=A0ABT3XWC4_9FLAO|nr:hypothetical protein [Chryseobacterium formosus]MCX8525978.1 hypothetical protein [Chryseobacterium formosus]
MSKNETGHAKNIANANLLCTHLIELGVKYNPSNQKLLLTNLQNIYNNAFTHQETVNNSVAPYSLAVDHREKLFAPVSKKITKLRKMYKATEGVTVAQLEDFMTIARKLKGIKKVSPSVTTDPNEEKNQISASQMSYDQRTNNYDLLISLLESTPGYTPNETEYQVATLKQEKTDMLQATQSVSDFFIPLNTARTVRNNAVYNSEDNLVDTFNKAKDYLFTILDGNSLEYKAISKIKFKKQ